MNEHPTGLLLPAIGIPALLLLSGSIALFRKERSLPCLMQLAGAAALMVVVLAHVAEVLHVLRWMGWGQEHSVGHYVDFVSASLGLVLFPVGYALHAFATHPTRRRGV